jgi:hypothetical protein
MKEISISANTGSLQGIGIFEHLISFKQIFRAKRIWLQRMSMENPQMAAMKPEMPISVVKWLIGISLLFTAATIIAFIPSLALFCLEVFMRSLRELFKQSEANFKSWRNITLGVILETEGTIYR